VAIARRALTATLLLLAAYHVLLTISTVSAYGLRYPFMDQFRCNLRYLTMPFPQSVLALENGHRPIVPGLVRVVELKWLGGTQSLQAATAWLAAGLAAAILALEIHRGLRGNTLLQAAGLCVIGTLLGWNANARMFIHSFEAVHVFYILFFVVASVEFAMRASGRSPALSWIASSALCVAATFTFGPGIASFAALMSVAVLRRVGFRLIGLVAVAAIATLLVYYLMLPGSAGVRDNVAASPATVFFALARLGAMFAEIVRSFVPVPAVVALVAWLAGGMVVALLAPSVIGRWRRRDEFSDLETLGLALFVFGVTTNTLIAASRTAYFFDHPGELFADRYLFWSCVAWVGLITYGLARLSYASGPSRYAGAAGIAVLSLCAIPSAVWANGWSAEVYRLSELTAVAQRLTIRDDATLAAISDEGPIAASRALDEMRKRKLAMFAERVTMQLGDKVPMVNPRATVRVTTVNVATAGSVGKVVRLLSGTLNERLASEAMSSQLWFVGSDGTLIGRAALTYGLPTNRLRLGRPKWVGFQGYVPQSDASEVFLAAVTEGTATPLARLELRQ